MFDQLDIPSPTYFNEFSFKGYSKSIMSLDNPNYDHETEQSCKSIFKNRLIFNSILVSIKYKNGKYHRKRLRFKGNNLVISSLFSTKKIHSSSIKNCFSSNMVVVIETEAGESISIKVNHRTTAISMAIVLSNKDNIRSMYF